MLNNKHFQRNVTYSSLLLLQNALSCLELTRTSRTSKERVREKFLKLRERAIPPVFRRLFRCFFVLRATESSRRYRTDLLRGTTRISNAQCDVIALTGLFQKSFAGIYSLIARDDENWSLYPKNKNILLDMYIRCIRYVVCSILQTK